MSKLKHSIGEKNQEFCPPKLSPYLYWCPDTKSWCVKNARHCKYTKNDLVTKYPKYAPHSKRSLYHKIMKERNQKVPQPQMQPAQSQQILEQAYDDDIEHNIELNFECNNEKLSVTFIDDGIPFNPFNERKVDTTLSVEDRDIGGLGIFLVKELVDSYKYNRKINQNVVVITIKLAK